MAETPFALKDKAEPYSPEWWLKRLTARLRWQQLYSEPYDEFYGGDQPMAFASDKFEKIFGKRYKSLPANFMPLVIEAEAERLAVQGFRFGKTAADKGVWQIWQANQLDAESQIAHEIALVKGMAFAAVDPSKPGAVITIEDPAEVAVETSPGNRRDRLAGIKVFLDAEGRARAYVFLPDVIYKWRNVRQTSSEQWSWENSRWEAYQDEGEDWPVVNRLGVVPTIPLLNRPKRDGTGRSEIHPVIGNQNAINKLRFDALVASEYVAFPQRYAINIDIPVDPDTGKDIAPFRPGVDNLWALRRPTPADMVDYADKVPVPQLGQFPASDLSPYINMIRQEIGEMSSISRTPYHYLLGEPSSIPPSGESIKSSEAPLVKKVGRQAIHFGEGWEETMRVALIATGQGTKARADAETIWVDPETRNEAARTDSIIKQFSAGIIPEEIAQEELGYTQTQIERIKLLKGGQLTEKQLTDRVAAAGVLVRSGYAPDAALVAVGLDPVKHLGFLPVTVLATAPPEPAQPEVTE